MVDDAISDSKIEVMTAQDVNSKYTTQAEAIKPENKDKIIISDDMLALITAIEKLTSEIARSR